MAAPHSELPAVDSRTKNVWFMQCWEGCDLEVEGIDALLHNFLQLIGWETRAYVRVTPVWCYDYSEAQTDVSFMIKYGQVLYVQSVNHLKAKKSVNNSNWNEP